MEAGSFGRSQGVSDGGAELRMERGSFGRSEGVSVFSRRPLDLVEHYNKDLWTWSVRSEGVSDGAREFRTE